MDLDYWNSLYGRALEFDGPAIRNINTIYDSGYRIWAGQCLHDQRSLIIFSHLALKLPWKLCLRTKNHYILYQKSTLATCPGVQSNSRYLIKKYLLLI